MILAVTLIYGVFLAPDESGGRPCLRTDRSADSLLSGSRRGVPMTHSERQPHVSDRSTAIDLSLAA